MKLAPDVVPTPQTFASQGDWAADGLSRRELDVLDVAICWCKAKGDGQVPSVFVVDVSQDVKRRSWTTDGMIPSLHKHMKIWMHNHGVLSIRSLFQVMGWPCDRIPPQIPQSCRTVVFCWRGQCAACIRLLYAGTSLLQYVVLMLFLRGCGMFSRVPLTKQISATPPC